MTKRTLSQIRELDSAAERAGGYVVSPDKVKTDSKAANEFTKIRRYSIEHKIPISQMTDSDYKRLGINR